MFDDIIKLGYKVVVLGSGDAQYEQFFHEMRWRYPDRVAFTCGYIPDLAKKIYAGANMFLMPSKSEPCGLAQMISLRYGTIPIVRKTGGLADSIIDNFRRTLTERKLPNEITMSIGIATTVKQDSNDMVTFEELYSNSDKALYLSKNSGKNQYHFY